jgi:Mn-dependent DtxR family transcriptional regulator
MGSAAPALEIVRHHRLIETFLYEVLNYPIGEIHDEAERLVHFLSESFEKRIVDKLGNRTAGIAYRLSMVLCPRLTG